MSPVKNIVVIIVVKVQTRYSDLFIAFLTI